MFRCSFTFKRINWRNNAVKGIRNVDILYQKLAKSNSDPLSKKVVCKQQFDSILLSSSLIYLILSYLKFYFSFLF